MGKVESTDTWANFPPRSATTLNSIDESYRTLYPDGDQGPLRYFNAPIGLQIVGRRLQEEKLLAMAASIEEAVRPQALISSSSLRQHGDVSTAHLDIPSPVDKGDAIISIAEVDHVAAFAA